jgi:S-formylglutathione hydrolase FrmB
MAQGRAECGDLPSAVLHHKVRYCALLPPGYDPQRKSPYPVLYYLHGLGDDERALVDSGAWNLVDDLRQSGKLGDLVVATPDGGRSFYINARDGREAYEDFFLREFLPGMERKYHAGGARRLRAIAGVSMGGYGALRFAFQHPEMFAAVGAQMPALYDRLPPALTSVVGHGRTLQGVEAFGMPPDEKFWQQESPLTLAKEAGARLRSLKIYFDCGDQDDFGFDAGTRQMDRILTESDVPHESHIYPGGHDAAYVAGHFAALLQFVWQGIKAESPSASK